MFIPEYFVPENATEELVWSRPVQAEESKPLEIFSITERLETNEEAEERKRLEEEEKKKQKKGAKKDEAPVDDTPKKVKQCQQSNIKLSGTYPLMSRWIASCFQMIKDAMITDVHTKESMYDKIYP